ncbi:MAG: hypothetical protein KAS65_09375, partial [Candidatus Aminicenantes bacterium]|nr:hypothetical protein [Candidatus Aminicenantes bacterium]
SALETFQKALDQSAFVFKENPELTFPQIYNRAQWKKENNEFFKNKLTKEENKYNKPWLKLITRLKESSTLIRTCSGHIGPVNACAFSPDGKKIAAGDKSGQFFLLSIENEYFSPPIITPIFSSGKLSYLCLLCIKRNFVIDSTQGKEVICEFCGEKHKLNPFFIKS